MSEEPKFKYPSGTEVPLRGKIVDVKPIIKALSISVEDKLPLEDKKSGQSS